MVKRPALVPVFLLAAACWTLCPAAQAPARSQSEVRDYVRASYTKYEFMVPMRDGVRLFTSVYAPKDTSQTYPILFYRTPYTIAPYGIDNYARSLGPSDKYLYEGFIFAAQDVRGQGKSEGEFVNVRPYIPVKRGPRDIDETTDTYDTIEWLIKNVPNHNGKVGISGISYPGFYAAMAAIDAHPALKAASPQAPVDDWFLGDDWRHNGALFLAHTYNFFVGFGRPHTEAGNVPPPRFDFGTADGYDYFLRIGPLRNIDVGLFQAQGGFWKELMEHDRYDDYWQSRDVRRHLKNIRPAMMTVGGWYDAEDVFGPLNVYRAVESQSPGSNNTLVMGPWSHGAWGRSDGDRLGNIRFGTKTAVYYRDNIEFPFFLYHLKGKGDPKLPEAFVFETGRNQWRRHDAWPPKETVEKTLYFHPGGKLSFEPEAGSNNPGFDEYVSDPSKPVPFTDEVTTAMTYNYMTSDQRFAARRTDVLVYETDPLEGDVTVAGPLEPTLHVSTTGTDSDWVVKLIDIYPGDAPDPDPNPTGVRMGGYQRLIRGEPFRGRFRSGFDKPQPFEPGQVAKVTFVMPDVYHTFRRGHRIAVHIQSSWFPLVDRNPQKFVKVSQATEADFQKATQRVYRSSRYPSSLKVRVLP